MSKIMIDLTADTAYATAHDELYVEDAETGSIEEYVASYDDGLDRLGELVENHEAGFIMQWENRNEETVYFAWVAHSHPNDYFETGRGYPRPTIELARKVLGVAVPLGCSDFNGTRLGKLVERGTLGEVYKLADQVYFVWSNETNECQQVHDLWTARSLIGCAVQRLVSSKKK